LTDLSVIIIASMPLRTPEELFFEKVEKANDSGCQLWTGYVDEQGYGKFGVGTKTYSVHRARYIIEHGSIPAFHDIIRTCGNRLCVTLEHLSVVHHRAPKKKSEQ
jgi:hypothetical protein